MKMSRISIALVVLSLIFATPVAFTKGNGGGGGGGGHGGGGRGAGGISHGSLGGGAPQFSSAPRHYSPSGWTGRQYYHPTTTHGTGANGSRSLSYPAVHGSTVHNVHHVNGVNRTARVHSSTGSHNNSGASSQNGRNTQHHATTHNYTNAASTGKWSHSNWTGRSTLDPQTSARLRNWNGKRDNFAQAHWNHEEHCHHHHGRNWWRNHCAAIIFFNWGYWAWDAGWWYPAWGYDPYYSYYEDNEPIYGYDGLPPDQVVADVQGALQQLGYYRYAVDGIIGPLTRAAIADYQRDNGLPLTSAIDEPLLVSLGFIAP